MHVIVKVSVIAIDFKRWQPRMEFRFLIGFLLFALHHGQSISTPQAIVLSPTAFSFRPSPSSPTDFLHPPPYPSSFPSPPPHFDESICRFLSFELEISPVNPTHLHLPSYLSHHRNRFLSQPVPRSICPSLPTVGARPHNADRSSRHGPR